MNKVLNFILSGANGFIGSQLVDKLIREGCNVVCLNLFLQSSIIDTLKTIRANPGAEWILINCSSPNEIRIMNEAILGVDSLSPIYTLLEFMKVARLSHLIHFSTIQVYGTNLVGEVYFDGPICIETQYAKVHYDIENYIKMKFSEAGIKSVILRLSNVYGSRAKYLEKRNTLVPNCFVLGLLNKSTLTLLSSGKQTKNFLPISQLSRKIIEVSQQGFDDSYVDICASDYYISILDTAEICLAQYSKVLGKTGTLEITSDMPLEATKFKLIPKYSNPMPNGISPTEEFQEAIGDLFRDNAKERGSYG